MNERERLVGRGLLLNYATIGYNVLEAIAALVAGVMAGSVALVGFGFDSMIEVTASGAAQWRLRSDTDLQARERVERVTTRIIAICFLVLAAYVTYDSISALASRHAPDRSLFGVTVLALSVVIMPILARAKRKVAVQLSSRALQGDAKQTSLCAYLSVIALVGVGLNAFAGWWWADPLAALAMVPIIVREGIDGLREEPDQCSCAAPLTY